MTWIPAPKTCEICGKICHGGGKPIEGEFVHLKENNSVLCYNRNRDDPRYLCGFCVANGYGGLFSDGRFFYTAKAKKVFARQGVIGK